MNGIGAFFARESVPGFNQILKPMCNAYVSTKEEQFINAVIIKKDKKDNNVIEWDYEFNGKGEIDYSSFENFYSDNMKLGDLIIFGVNVEVLYDSDNKFVITNDSSNVRTFKTSEMSLSYLQLLYSRYRDMKRTLEDCQECDINLLACDVKKGTLMSANDGHAGIQMCHSYIKGIGFMLHENMVCLRNIIHDFTDCSQDAVNLWETWYGHPLEQEVIRETDLESGAMRKIKFNPKWSY